MSNEAQMPEENGRAPEETSVPPLTESSQPSAEPVPQPPEADFTLSTLLAFVGALGVVVMLLIPSRSGEPAARSERLEREARAELVAQQVDALRAELDAEAAAASSLEP